MVMIGIQKLYKISQATMSKPEGRLEIEILVLLL